MNLFEFIDDYDIPMSIHESDSVTEFIIKRKTLKAIGRLYRDLDLTVRDICNLYDFEYSPKYQKLFYQIYGPKGQGHGGSRRAKSKNFDKL